MNALRAIVYSSLRGYRTNRGTHRSGMSSTQKRHIEMIQPGMPIEPFDETEDDSEDLDAYESDFSNLAEYDKMHEKEMHIQKLKLKNQIVKQKYFKNEEPAMLTWSEKEQIRHLYHEDPENWTPDKLCKSFPASREAILKVLRSNWAPKTTTVIKNYDEKVKNNWELFRAGKLFVDPKLRAHLVNFKHRKISIMDEESMQKFLKPKPIFLKPKSTVFSSIINATSQERQKLEKKINNRKQITSARNDKVNQNNSEEALDLMEITKRNSSKGAKESITLDMFIKKHIEGVTDNEMTPVDRVIVDEHKRRTTEAYKSETLVLESDSAVGYFAKTEEITSATKDEKSLVTTSSEIENSNKIILKNIDESSLETGIIAREKKEDNTGDDYPEYIKIPKKAFKRGATYRVNDCYYDDKGEFLYRVPGLKF